jgi:hypothetical protein
VNTSSFYEGALAVGNLLVNERCQSQCEDLRDDLSDRMYETDRSEVANALDPFFLW